MFAAAAIGTWWQRARAGRLPVRRQTADLRRWGGSNGYRVWLWKAELARLATATGLEITVCHLPPGTSTWNKIEHRLFSHFSMNWRGRPLTSHEAIVNMIANTRARTGPTVAAELDDREYPKGIKISDQLMRDIETHHIRRHDWHPEWNYTFNPR